MKLRGAAGALAVAACAGAFAAASREHASGHGGSEVAGPFAMLAAAPGAARARMAPAPRAGVIPRRHAAPASSGPAFDGRGYRLALAPYAFRFPRDHAAHPDYRTEWWYYTGHLDVPGSPAGRSRYGYELTFFRVGIDTAWRASRSAWAPREILFAHLALTDLRAGRFRFDERIARPALGMAGADAARYHTWVDDWSARLLDDGRTHRLRARMSPEPGRAGSDSIAIALDLVPAKPAACHGALGVSRKSLARGNASRYYSLTRLAANGSLSIGGRSLAVTGDSWMDHEFGSSELAPGQVGWDWFGLQLDDGRDLMLYRIRLRDGGTEPASSGTLVERDGRTRRLPLAAFAIERLATWKSNRTGGVYPVQWRVRVPAQGLDLRVTPEVADQELVTASAGGMAYWEGAVAIEGTAGGRRVLGRGYVELTGYAGAPLRF